MDSWPCLPFRRTGAPALLQFANTRFLHHITDCHQARWQSLPEAMLATATWHGELQWGVAIRQSVSVCVCVCMWVGR